MATAQPELVTVKALGDHYGSKGMVLVGQFDTRAPDDANCLAAQGVAGFVTPPPGKQSAKAKAG